MRHARSCAHTARARARARGCTGEGDRPTKIKSTSARTCPRGEGRRERERERERGGVGEGGKERGRGRGRGRERERGPRICCCWQGEARRRTRGRVTPECPRFLLSVPSLLSPARSVPLALTRVPQSSLSLSLSFSPAGRAPFSPYLPPCRALSPDSPHPRDTLSLFFLYFLCPPLVQMARTISRRVSWAASYPARATNALSDRDNGEPLSKTAPRGRLVKAEIAWKFKVG